MKNLLIAIIAITLLQPVAAKTVKKKKSLPKSAVRSVTMRRTACFGKCPDYTIEIKPAGNITYTGIRFVKDSGTYTKNIGTENAMKIINMFIANRIDTCKNTYENRIPDAPGLMFTIKFADSTKTIYNANWGPQFLKDISEAIDKAGKKTGKGWKKLK